MSKEKAKKDIDALRDEIRHHNHRYFVLNDPQISDKEYDILVEKLKALEDKFPEFITKDSPTQRIGAQLLDGFKTVSHKVKLLSLDNTYSQDELKNWDDRVRRLIGSKAIEYVAELKIDGVSCALLYEDGIFTRGSTRGDGTRGEDITGNLRTIPSIPLRLRLSNNSPLPKAIEVRAEIYMDTGSFNELNNKRKRSNEDVFANPRNATSGSLKLLDPSIVKKRRLNCFVHSFGWVSPKGLFETHWGFLERAKEYGFCVNPASKLCKSLREVIDFCNEWSEKREELSYQVDGMVIKINSFKQQDNLGSTLKSPRWAVAYKFKAAQATTRIINIISSVGRTGVITPVAELEPVLCGGVTIKHATLHNFDEIERLQVKIGDKVLIERAGDVIPKVIKVISSLRSGKEKKIKIPLVCPICKAKITRETREVAYRCINSACPAQLKQGLMHFASRQAMDIEGMGESVVAQLVDKNIVNDFSDIYNLKKYELLHLELFKEKKADNLIAAIYKSKQRPLSRLIYALGIRHVGQKASFILASKFQTLDNIMKATRQDLENIYEVGSVMAESIVNFFKQKQNIILIGHLKKQGLNMCQSDKIIKNKKISGKVFVFTGELEEFSRSKAQSLVRSLGGNATSSVSRHTDFLVAGSNPGSKYKKAKKLEVKIIDEKTFKELLK